METDALVRKTMALVEGVNSHRPRAAAAETPAAAPAAPARVAPMRAQSEREEIQRRVSAFRAHQLRLREERESYYVATLERARSNLRQ